MTDSVNQRAGPDDDPEQDAGVSGLKLMELPPVQRKIMRLLLRKTQLSDGDLRTALAALAEGEPPPREECDAALAALRDQGWLQQTGEAEAATYRAQRFRKTAKAGMSRIYETLDLNLESLKKPPPAGGTD
ncbi:MAG TPA: hypothetical protein VKY74_24295 [Chloroflexia bacterium]|nr:hypothetical protein [Chloroflexia bacterium]